MTDERPTKRRRGRERPPPRSGPAQGCSPPTATTPSPSGTSRSGPRSRCAGDHTLGSKADVFRAVPARREVRIVSAAPSAPDPPSPPASCGRRRWRRRPSPHPSHCPPALNGLSYERSIGQLDVTERLIELAEHASTSAPAAERAEKDLDPRLVIGCFVSLLLGWTAAGSWIRPALGLQDMDDAELIGGVERILLGLLSSNVAGVGRDDRRGA